MKTERMTFVMTPEDKAEITKRAFELEIPASELIRRAVDRYEPDDDVDEKVLLRIAEELEGSAKATERKLDDALAAVRQTVAQLRQSWGAPSA
jgi:hypothetical protein